VQSAAICILILRRDPTGARDANPRTRVRERSASATSTSLLSDLTVMVWNLRDQRKAVAVMERDPDVRSPNDTNRSASGAEPEDGAAPSDFKLVSVTAHERVFVEQGKALAASQSALAETLALLRIKEAQIGAYEAEQASFGAAVGRWLTRQRGRWATPGTRRGRLFSLTVRAIRLWSTEGILAVARATRGFLSRERTSPAPVPPQGVDVSAFFDASYYLEMNPDVAATGSDPLEHYLSQGWLEGRNPHTSFDTKFYLETNPDVAAMNVNPLQHFVARGWREGRQPVPHHCFDPRDLNPTLALPTDMGTPPRADPTLLLGSKVAVHLHVFYLDGLEMVLEYLQNIPCHFDLIITTDTERKAVTIRRSLPDAAIAARTSVRLCPNLGRDLAPLFVGLGAELLEYDVALHLHVKKSIHKEDQNFGRNWLRHNLNCLLYDRTYVSAVLRLFEYEPSCGVVHPQPYRPIVPFMQWGANRDIAVTLLDCLGLPRALVDGKRLVFPAGSMFWLRPRAITQLLQGKLTYSHFQPEPLPDDGTIPHALERLICYVSSHNGYHDRSIAPLPAETALRMGCPPQVSVIVPVLNAERTLHAALQSVLQQRGGFVNPEIIIVDNGSTDQSPRLADFYSRTYPNVSLSSEPARGAGAARNAGISRATADHVCFLDADDMLTSNALERLYAAAFDHDADLVVAKLRTFHETQLLAAIPSAYGSSNGVHDLRGLAADPSSSVSATVLLELEALFSDFGPCAKLYQRRFLIDNAIRFPESKNYEDNEFVYAAYLNARRLVALGECVYLYRRYDNTKGATQSTRSDLIALHDQLHALDAISRRIEGIANPALRAVLARSLIGKLHIYGDQHERSGDHMQRLEVEIRRFLAHLDPESSFESTRAILGTYLGAHQSNGPPTVSADASTDICRAR
jgi:glycosyltransferase involved in cell wall biosynthesis